jgi:hypothetical protein
MIERVPIARRGSTKLIPHVSKRRMRPILDLDSAIGLAAAAVDAVAEFSRDRLSAMELLEGRLQPEVNAGFEPGPRRRERRYAPPPNLRKTIEIAPGERSAARPN